MIYLRGARYLISDGTVRITDVILATHYQYHTHSKPNSGTNHTVYISNTNYIILFPQWEGFVLRVSLQLQIISVTLSVPLIALLDWVYYC